MHSACRWWREAAPAANVLGRSALGMLCLRSAHQTGTPPSVSPVPQRGSLARRIGGTRGRGETYSARRVFRFKTKTPATSPSSGVRGPVCAIGSPRLPTQTCPPRRGLFHPEHPASEVRWTDGPRAAQRGGEYGSPSRDQRNAAGFPFCIAASG
jgi:hypothetical protein